MTSEQLASWVARFIAAWLVVVLCLGLGALIGSVFLLGWYGALTLFAGSVGAAGLLALALGGVVDVLPDEGPE